MAGHHSPDRNPDAPGPRGPDRESRPDPAGHGPTPDPDVTPGAGQRRDVEPAGDSSGGGGNGEREDGPVCDLCGALMIERHCKLVCPRCGYQRDCSDP